MKYKYVLFDYDGTIADTTDGIIDGVEYLIKKYGFKEMTREEMKVFVGPPLATSLAKYSGFTAEQAVKARAEYRDYYNAYCLDKNPVYPGVKELLEKLHAEGRSLGVATSKHQPIVEMMLKNNGVLHLLSVVSAQEEEAGRLNKHDCIVHALKTMGVEDLSEAVIIGDRFYDVLGAKEAGIDCIGVLWGVGDRAELESAGAAAICETAAELYEALN